MMIAFGTRERGRIGRSQQRLSKTWVAERRHCHRRQDMTQVMESSPPEELREVELLLEGVEAARRMENPSDKQLGIVRHQFDVPVNVLDRFQVYSGANPRKNPKV